MRALQLFRFGLCTAALCIAAPVAQAQEASILNPSGLPIPRFVSFKSDEVNVRVGPGKRYPIRWVYHRENLPVEIIEEFAHWRKIRDFEGVTGWVHKGLVQATRSAMILEGMQNIYRKPDATAGIVARAEAGAIGLVTQCTPDWCEMSFGRGRPTKAIAGWIRKSDIWGVTREEVFEE